MGVDMNIIWIKYAGCPENYASNGSSNFVPEHAAPINLWATKEAKYVENFFFFIISDSIMDIFCVDFMEKREEKKSRMKGSEIYFLTC